MTGLERTLKTLAGEKTDRIAVGLHNFLMAAQMMNLPIDQCTRDGQLLAESQIKAWEYFGHDVLLVENGVAAVAQAIGCEVRYAPDQPPHVEKGLIQTLDEVEKLQIHDPHTTFPLNEMLKAVRIIKDHIGDRAFVMGRADQGPMALACALYGPEKLVMDIALGENPEKVHALIEFCIRCTMRYASALHEAGADGTCIGGEGLSLISPQIFRDYEMPYEKMFVDHCHKEDFLVGVHVCGHEDPILNELVSTGADWLELDPSTSYDKSCQAIKDKCTILGMVDPVGTLRTGTPEEVVAECNECMGKMSSARFILGPGCALAADTPVENIEAMISAAKNYTLPD